MHAWGRFLAGGALCAVLIVSLTFAPARADGTGDAWTDGKNVGAGASTTGGDATSLPAGGRSKSKPVCSWVRLDPEHAAIADRMAEKGAGTPRGEGNGTWYRKICNDAAGSTAAVIWVPERVDPRVLAERAADQVAIPAVEIGLNPRPEQGAVVNVETWLWVDSSSWNAVTARASARNVVVTATAAPRRVIWDLGNGDSVTCADRLCDLDLVDRLGRLNLVEDLMDAPGLESEPELRRYVDIGRVRANFESGTLRLGDFFQDWAANQPITRYARFISVPVPMVESFGNRQRIPQYGVFNIDTREPTPLLTARTRVLLRLASSMATLAYGRHG